ncbi:MAG: hypothetical protein KA795_05980 [Burkholderiaceae bacterium]|nr:hypothetical protein [Burkholderiaceae bacterium]
MNTPPATSKPGTQVHPGEVLLAQFQQVLGREYPIAYNVNIARITGDVKAALFASQLLYWTRRGSDIERLEGWIFKTREQWTHETGLSRHEQESARTKLLALGLIEEQRTGMPPRCSYRINPRVLGHKLAQMLRQEPVQWSLLDLRAPHAQIAALLGRSLAFFRVFAEVTEAIPVAVLLAKAVALQSNVVKTQMERTARAQSPGGWDADWFHLAATQWQDETGLRASQIRDAKQKLCRLEILQEAIQTYPRRRSFYRVDLGALSKKMQAAIAQRGRSDGLLGQLLKGIQLAGNVTAGNDKPRVPKEARISAVTFREVAPAGTTSTDCGNQPSATKRPTASGGRSTTNCPTGSGGPTASNCPTEVSSPDWRTASAGRTAPNWRTGTPQSAYPPDTAKSDHANGQFPHPIRSISALNTASFRNSKRSLFAPLHARAVKGTTHKTTTTTTPSARPGAADLAVAPVVVVPSINPPDQVVWPKSLAEPVVQLGRRLLEALPIEQHQQLLDELAGRMGRGQVKSPLAYLGQLARLAEQGRFVPELAHEVRQQREGQHAAEARLQRALSGDPPDPNRSVFAASVRTDHTPPSPKPASTTEERRNLQALRNEFALRAGKPAVAIERAEPNAPRADATPTQPNAQSDGSRRGLVVAVAARRTLVIRKP